MIISLARFLGAFLGPFLPFHRGMIRNVQGDFPKSLPAGLPG